MSRFERSAAMLLGTLAVLQVVFGLLRARLTESSPAPALALAAVFAAVAALWTAKRFLRFPALLSATVGVLSAISAYNAPLIGTAARVSIPLMAFAIAAVLITAPPESPRWLQISALALYVVAFVVLELDLQRDAGWSARFL